MYCIDGVSTLKNCKPALIHWAVKQGQNNYAKKSFGVDLTKVANAFTGAFAPKAQLAYC